jgi:hypothetical protein
VIEQPTDVRFWHKADIGLRVDLKTNVVCVL